MTTLPYICASCARRWKHTQPGDLSRKLLLPPRRKLIIPTALPPLLPFRSSYTPKASASAPTSTTYTSPNSHRNETRSSPRPISAESLPHSSKPARRLSPSSTSKEIPPPNLDLSTTTPFPSRPLAPSPPSLALRWDATPPTTSQLSLTTRLFTTQPATFLTSSPFYRSLSSTPPPAQSASRRAPPPPEVAFLGRSNVGKSSLLNALLSSPNLCHTSSRPGRTRSLNLLSCLSGQFLSLDVPGYGRGSRATWGTEILQYLTHRRQLRRVFVLIDAEHGLKQGDVDLLGILARLGLSYQIVLTKADKLVSARWLRRGGGTPQILDRGLERLETVMQGVRERVDPGVGDGKPAGVSAWGEILAVSAERRWGLENLRWSVLCAVGLDGKGRVKVASREERRRVLAEDSIGRESNTDDHDRDDRFEDIDCVDVDDDAASTAVGRSSGYAIKPSPPPRPDDPISRE